MALGFLQLMLVGRFGLGTSRASNLWSFRHQVVHTQAVCLHAIQYAYGADLDAGTRRSSQGGTCSK